MASTMKPGVYVGMDMDEYLADGSLSASGCKELNEDAGRYWHNSGNNVQPEELDEVESVARKFGTAYHMMIFEPARFNTTYRIKAGQQETRMPGFLGEGEFSTMQMMRLVLMSGQERRELLKDHVPEVSIFWLDEETGVPCRVRVDSMSPIAWIDLKALRDVRTAALRVLIPNFGFDITGAMYSEAARALKKMIAAGYKMPKEFSPAFIEQFMAKPTQQFGFMMQEKTAPYIVRTQLMTQGVSSIGIAKVRQAISKYQLATEVHKPGQPWGIEYPEIENMEIEALSQSIYYN